MDLATLVGIIGAFAIVIAAMVLGGAPHMFLNVPSLLIVVGGTLFAVLMKYELGQFLAAGKIAVKAFMFKLQSPEDLISEVVDMAAEARKGGLLSLEGKESENKFLMNGIQLLVDGHDPEVVRTLLTKEMNLAVERHDAGSSIFSQLGEVAPAMGMIGTLIGLVAMLANMDDPKSIGPAMAVALLTTLYGAMIANMFAQPVADKLNLRAGQEAMSKRMVIDALLAIQAGQNPKVIESMLRTYLAEGKRPPEI
ncbi:flagellar motor protein PomA [Litoribrevibacter euphylliae]|uniref:Flagellar motor protein PomA n=1 Tax=Litoribrevibacter euphylliae TaxID=1834034 RepID=A0ABV7HI80_9GAMM